MSIPFEAPLKAIESILIDSEPIPYDVKTIKGLNLEKDVITLSDIYNSYSSTGFQASNLAMAINEINRMLSWRLSDEDIDTEDIDTSFADPEVRKKTKCTIWLSFTSNMISSGLREIFVYLAKHKLVDVFVTSGGGIEEDFIKCLSDTYLGSFSMKGSELRQKGWNRIGNLLVPNNNYCLFEDWLQPILDQMLYESYSKIQSSKDQNKQSVYKEFTKTSKNKDLTNQEHNTFDKSNRENMGLYLNSEHISNNFNENFNFEKNNSKNNNNYNKTLENVLWTPSTMIDRLGQEINDERSLYYWCHKNKIPVFCPGITDGSLGDNLYFHSYRNPGLVLDVIQDIKAINDKAVKAKKSGIIILGGGIPKHHVCNANLMRNGSDFAVYINTGQEFDGSDSGASPDEAISWGKIKESAKPVKVYADASIAFPIIAAATFHKYVQNGSDN